MLVHRRPLLPVCGQGGGTGVSAQPVPVDDGTRALDLAVAALDDLIRNRFPKDLPEALQVHPDFVQLYANIKELREVVAAITAGDLSRRVTQKGFCAGSLRSLQSKLRHLTWQTQMIAAGDFSQRVDFLGEFSTAFNSMTAALAKAKADLEDSERRYRLLAENVRDMIITLGFDGQVMWVSPSIGGLLGYTQEEWVGHTIDEIFAYPSAQTYKETLKRYMTPDNTANLPPTLEAQLVRKDGSTVWTETSLSPLTDGEGNRTGLVGVVRDISDRKRIQDDLYRLATTDALTGAINRRHFWQLSNQEVQRSIRYGHPLSLIIMDVDHFKSFNDTYGHAAGDLVLRTLAQVGQKCIRATDVFARIGGEEFTVLLPSVCLDGAISVAERLRRTFEELRIRLDSGETISFTVSAGVAERTPADRTFEDLFRAADTALYEAKNGGRNRICFRRAEDR